MPTDPPEDITPSDRYRYTSNAFAQSHPARLATVAAAFGIASAPATGCRVLELGCGDGSNLIPLAFYLPDSTCVGVDLARTRSEEHTSELQSPVHLVCRLLLEKKKKTQKIQTAVHQTLY